MLRTKLDALFERLTDTALGAQIFQFLSDSAFGFAEIARWPVGARRVFDRTFNRPLASSVQLLTSSKESAPEVR
jgi:hypothetical protein